MRDASETTLPSFLGWKRTRGRISQTPQQTKNRQHEYCHADTLMRGQYFCFLQQRMRILRLGREHKLRDNQHDNRPMKQLRYRAVAFNRTLELHDLDPRGD